jgi:hypothetical protein
MRSAHGLIDLYLLSFLLYLLLSLLYLAELQLDRC